jgi:hypothetical protein
MRSTVSAMMDHVSLRILLQRSKFGSYKQLRQGKPSPVDTDMAREVELEKESLRQLALNVYKGLKEGTEEIYPDKYAAEFSLLLKAVAAV